MNNLKMAIVWGLVLTAVFVGVQWWEHEELKSKQRVAVSAVGQKALVLERGRDRHYTALTKVNGKEFAFMLDTGATSTAIPANLAKALNLPIQGQTRVNTANGTIDVDLTRIRLEIENLVTIDNLRVTILPDNDDRGLLGMDVLGRLRLVQEGERLTLEAK